MTGVCYTMSQRSWRKKPAQGVSPGTAAIPTAQPAERAKEIIPGRQPWAVESMPHSLSSIWLHAIFSTKGRRPWLSAEVRARLLPYMMAVLGKSGALVRAIDGVEDHLHLLMRVRPEASPAEVMRVLKANSSKWIHATFPELGGFAWQGGYSVFTVSVSQCGKVEAYIAGQEEHHRRQGFEEELRAFLVRHEVAYDERDLQI
ncbi:MAG: IS200/IS605 family transposase [Planctomycetes bacterium]|nr:IS200/IS605 family transposase [Planctomycetota bacterium]